MEYGGVSYHDFCFNCQKCRKPVGDEKFCTHEGHIYCQSDYDSLFGVKCGECGEVIDGQMVESPLHATGYLHPRCLKCALCGRAIGGDEYFPNDKGIPYCTKDCKHKAASMPPPPAFARPAPQKPYSPVVIKVKNDKCSACGKDCYNLDKMDIMNRLWHKKCFKCHVCQVKLTPTTYLGSNGNPYCKVHYPAPAPTSLPL